MKCKSLITRIAALLLTLTAGGDAAGAYVAVNCRSPASFLGRGTESLSGNEIRQGYHEDRAREKALANLESNCKGHYREYGNYVCSSERALANCNDVSWH